MAFTQITAKELTTGAVTFNKLKYDSVTGKAREVPCFIMFAAADIPVAAPHGLGRVPTAFVQGASGRVTGAPGTVYTDDLPLKFSKHNVVFKCTTANTWAIVLLR